MIARTALGHRYRWGVLARSLAPDLARGLMLLMIAWANVGWYLHGSEPGLVMPHAVPTTMVDTVLQVLMITFVDGKVFPMFAFLFAYGMVQFWTSRRRRDFDDQSVSRMLARRHVAMLVLGLLHAALLFMGDVLGTWALCAIVAGPIFFKLQTPTLRVWAWVTGGFAALVSVGVLVGGVLAGRDDPTIEGLPIDGAGSADYGLSMLARIGLWVVNTPIAALFLTVPFAMLLGWLAGRARLIDDPAAHRRTLVRIVLVTLPLTWLAGATQAALHLRLLPIASWSMDGWDMGLNVLAGPGYAALFGLMALRFDEHRPAWVMALASTGQRSLSCYLWQSIALAPVLSAWGLGLGARLTTWSSLLLATVVWAVAVPVADVLRRRGLRGPFEAVLRRITYGKERPNPLPPGWVILMPWEPRPALPPHYWAPPQWAPPPAVPVGPPAAPQQSIATPVRPRD